MLLLLLLSPTDTRAQLLRPSFLCGLKTHECAGILQVFNQHLTGTAKASEFMPHGLSSYWFSVSALDLQKMMFWGFFPEGVTHDLLTHLLIVFTAPIV